MLSATCYYNVARHPAVVSVLQLHCIINPFVSVENLHNYAGKQYAQWIHEQTSEGVAARQPCGGNL